jgi:hypothetical protein
MREPRLWHSGAFLCPMPDQTIRCGPVRPHYVPAAGSVYPTPGEGPRYRPLPKRSLAGLFHWRRG